MKFASIRDFRINASKVFKDAGNEEVIVTRHGHPLALLVPITEGNLDTVRQAVARVRLGTALKDSWKEAEDKGTHQTTMEEIDAEIQRYRQGKSTPDRS